MLGADLQMKKRPQPSTAEVLEYLSNMKYDKTSGKIINLKGKHIGTKDKRGYLVYNILGKQFKVHRLIWLLETGDFPNGVIDHIDGVKDNNRISNLRDTTDKVNRNNPNNKLSSQNKSGVSGVSWCNTRKKWCVRLQKGDKYRFMGYYESKKEAIEAVFYGRT